MNEQTYQHEGLTLVVRRLGTKATVLWQGVSDSRHPAQFLNPVIDELGDSLQNTDVTIDLRHLQYMNSSTVQPLIAMIRRLDANGRPVRVVFLDVDWQRTHRNCMSAMARTFKNVQIEKFQAS
jgi:anti-anti-sigma regulatory factor